jgi:hypothetical protein
MLVFRRPNKINRRPNFQNLMPGSLKQEVQFIFRVGSDPGFLLSYRWRRSGWNEGLAFRSATYRAEMKAVLDMT